MPNATWTHCFLHREAFGTKKMQNVLNEVVKIVNFMKIRSLQSRLLTTLCEEMETQHTRLLLRIRK